jgi:hypothetical protein
MIHLRFGSSLVPAPPPIPSGPVAYMVEVRRCRRGYGLRR